MEFFEKIGKKASDTYKMTAEKASKLAEEAKLKHKMNENKEKINGLYKEIGQRVYEKDVNSMAIDIEEELEKECTQIDVLSEDIERILKDILALKDKKKCSKCSSEINKDAKFCPICGEEQESDVKEGTILENNESDEQNSNTTTDNDANIQESNNQNVEMHDVIEVEAVNEKMMENGNAPIEENSNQDANN